MPPAAVAGDGRRGAVAVSARRARRPSGAARPHPRWSGRRRRACRCTDVDGVSAAIVLGPTLAAAVAGAALAVSLPGVSALGRQIAAGPCSRRVAVMAGLVVPGAVGAVTVLPSLLAACVTIARELPGGPVAGVALAAAIVAAVPAGAVAAEGGVARRPRTAPAAARDRGWSARVGSDRRKPGCRPARAPRSRRDSAPRIGIILARARRCGWRVLLHSRSPGSSLRPPG